MPKKAKEKAKRPVGRPRKNLGTRVSDVPVTTLKPMPRRINVDSVALQRARMAYKRDFPDKPLSENQTRAFLDAMQSGKAYGPIGSRILGTTKRTTVGNTEFGFMDYYKDALAEKKSEEDAAKGIVLSVDTVDGSPSLRLNPRAISTALISTLRSSIAAPRTRAASVKAPKAYKSGARNRAVDVTEGSEALIDAIDDFQDRYGRRPTKAESRGFVANITAGRDPFAETDDEQTVVLPGSARVRGSTALFQRQPTRDEINEQNERDYGNRLSAAADASLPDIGQSSSIAGPSRSQSSSAAPSGLIKRKPSGTRSKDRILRITIGRPTSTIPEGFVADPDRETPLTAAQQYYIDNIDRRALSPGTRDRLIALVPTIPDDRGPGRRAPGHTVRKENAEKLVNEALQSGRMAQPSGSVDLAGVMNQATRDEQARIVEAAVAGDPSALAAVQASLPMAPSQEQVAEEAIVPVVPVVAGMGFDAVGDNRSDWSIMMNAMKNMKSNAARGSGFFDRDGMDEILYPMPKTVDSMQILRDLKAKQARGEPLDGSGLGVQKKRGDYKLASAEFSDKVWNSASSLRWIRSAGLRPLKRAVHEKGKLIYHMTDMSKLSKLDPQVATLKNGRKIVLVYGK
jgi:hypothetical protein